MSTCKDLLKELTDSKVLHLWDTSGDPASGSTCELTWLGIWHSYLTTSLCFFSRSGTRIEGACQALGRHSSQLGVRNAPGAAGLGRGGGAFACKSTGLGVAFYPHSATGD